MPRYDRAMIGPVACAEVGGGASRGVRVVVVAPTYNHGRTVGEVLRGLARYALPIVVVNDGATDGTAAELERWVREGVGGPARRVVTHGANLGKAAALRSGFAEAVLLGGTHAATIDTDGQHDVADLGRLIELAAVHGGSLIVGTRSGEGAGAPIRSRVGRAVSNLLVRVESGVRVADSQSGMRVYPLGAVAGLGCCGSRYGFETEVLSRAGWRGVGVMETPIRCIYRVPGGRTTHFRAFGDTAAAIGMHAGLLGRALLVGPAPAEGEGEGWTGTIPRRLARWFSPRRLRGMARGDAASRERLAASVGVGLLMATLPIYGVKTVACLWLAGRFRLHPLMVVGVSSLSTPPLGLAFVGLSIGVGGVLLHGRVPNLGAIDLAGAARWSSVNALVVEWAVGSVVAGAALGVLGYAAARAVLRRPSLPPPLPAGGSDAAEGLAATGTPRRRP